MIIPAEVYGYTTHLSYAGAHDLAVRCSREVTAPSDCVAATLAAAWQSPGPRGAVLATIANGRQPFDTDDAYDALREIEDAHDSDAFMNWLYDLEVRVTESD